LICGSGAGACGRVLVEHVFGHGVGRCRRRERERDVRVRDLLAVGVAVVAGVADVAALPVEGAHRDRAAEPDAGDGAGDPLGGVGDAALRPAALNLLALLRWQVRRDGGVRGQEAPRTHPGRWRRSRCPWANTLRYTLVVWVVDMHPPVVMLPPTPLH
jgi:hypothetical protein